MFLKTKKLYFTFFAWAATFLFPSTTVAHEVYVLTPEQVGTLSTLPSTPLYEIFFANVSDTLIWAGIIGFLIISVFFISISVTLENRFDKHLVKLKKFAPFVARITIGLAFIFCAYNAALFGPELPFSDMFGRFVGLGQIMFYALGLLMLFGIFSRIAGLIGIGIFAYAIVLNGVYMFTYLNYLAEFFVLVLVGSHKFSVTDTRPGRWSITKFLDYLAVKYGEFAFLILRVGFGFSLIYASVYAKIIHNQLAITVASDFGLDVVFGFSPEFIVLGAALIEILLGLFFIFGIEIRFNAIVLNVFLTLSLLYFGEAVWPHIILIGIPIAFFCYGYDKYSLEGYFFKKGNREPIF